MKLCASLSLVLAGIRRASSFRPPARSASAPASTGRAGAIARETAVRSRSSRRRRSSSAMIRAAHAKAEAYRAIDGAELEPPPAAPVECTPLPSVAHLVGEARRTYEAGVTRPYRFREEQLRGIERLVDENADRLAAALGEDLGQGPVYAEFFELPHVGNHARHSRAHLREWMETKRAPTPFPLNLSVPIRSEVAPEPRGVALIMTPWNMPVQLVLNPLIDALAAGCVCVLKMSERSVASTRLFTELLTCGKYVDPRAVRLVNGGVEEATALLEQRFDAIMYTGGGKVGRIVARAAARNLTPMLLELGGKNPVFVTKNAHLPSAALRIAWGKIAGNTGQMCLCPDYVLVEESVKEEFTNELCKAMDRMYPVSTYSDGGGGDVGRMISVEHAERVVGLLDSTCDVIYGGKHHDVKGRFVAPTIVEATAGSTIMKEEIFGPLLAVVSVPDLEGGIKFVNEHFTSRGEHPLVLYVFSRSEDERRRIAEAVPSGSVAVNEVLKQAANVHLPFGGVGASGMGAYYGKFGFDFFSHCRGTLVGNNRSTWRWDPTVWVTYPPYDKTKLRFFRALGRVPPALDKLKRLVPAAKAAVPIGFAVACILYPSLWDAALELNLKTILKWISQTLRGG